MNWMPRSEVILLWPGNSEGNSHIPIRLRGDVKESRKYGGMNWLRHKVQYHGNSTIRCTPYLTWVLTANS